MIHSMSLKRVLAMAGLTVVLLGVCFMPFNLWPLAYVALIPWTVAMIRGRARRRTLLIGWLAGWVYGLVWLYWLAIPTTIGYVAATAYLSVYWWVAAILLRAAAKRSAPFWIALPLVWVAFEVFRSVIIGGFTWFYLGHSQVSLLPMIQLADITGVYGISFVVAMVNGLGVDLLLKQRTVRQLRLPACAIGLLIGGMCVYGTYRIQQQTTEPGPTIAVVQREFPATLNQADLTAQQFMEGYLTQTLVSIAPGEADLIVWPETSSPIGLNTEFQNAQPAGFNDDQVSALLQVVIGPAATQKISPPRRRILLRRLVGDFPDDVLEDTARVQLLNIAGKRAAPLYPGNQWAPNTLNTIDHCAAAQADMIELMTELLNTPMLVGTTAVVPDRLDSSQWALQNAALWFDPDRTQRPLYAKQHPVQFSEYIPFRESCPWLFGLLRSCVPDAMPQLEPGRRTQRYSLTTDHGNYIILTPICYESAFAPICREMVNSGPKDRAVLVNLSNDGWFVHPAGLRGYWHMLAGTVPPKSAYVQTTEQSQHWVQSVFRAIENRVPVVRSVNTGISGGIDSTGRRIAHVAEGESMWGPAVAGTATISVRTDTRITLYSGIGDAFGWSVVIAWIFWTSRLWWSRRCERKQSSE